MSTAEESNAINDLKTEMKAVKESNAGVKKDFEEFKAEMRKDFAEFKAEMKGMFEEFTLSIRSHTTGIELVGPIAPAPVDGVIDSDHPAAHHHATSVFKRYKGNNYIIVVVIIPATKRWKKE